MNDKLFTIRDSKNNHVYDRFDYFICRLRHSDDIFDKCLGIKMGGKEQNNELSLLDASSRSTRCVKGLGVGRL